MEKVMERKEQVIKILSKYNLSELVNLLIKNLKTYGSDLKFVKNEQDLQVKIQVKSKLEDIIVNNYMETEIELKFVRIEIIDEVNEVIYKIKLIYEDDQLLYVRI